MFVVVLRFSVNKADAPNHMEGHKAWISRGFADGVFLMTGSLKPNAGGVVLAHNISRGDLEAWVKEDPFVAEDVVSAEIMEISPARVDQRLEFLMT
jgi:uncharacterized protein YciI